MTKLKTKLLRLATASASSEQRIVRHPMASKREWCELPECPNCGAKLHNHGAESHGDGDIYDLLVCEGHPAGEDEEGNQVEATPPCGPVYEWHASYCRCERCGGHGDRLINIYDQDYVPMPIPWY